MLAHAIRRRSVFQKADYSAAGVELFLIVHMFMDFWLHPGTDRSFRIVLGGEYTMIFWIFVVFLGIIFPGILSVMSLRGYKYLSYCLQLLFCWRLSFLMYLSMQAS